jgi:ParB/RepB/Spo0J family partition protein
MNNLKIETQGIQSSPYQVREISGTPELDASLMDLAANMREHGLINPITVRKLPSGAFECVAGHRRLAAARLNEWVEISAMVSDAMSDIAAEDMLVSENLYRQDLTAIEESATVVRLLKSREVADVAKLCHKSDRWVYRRMSIDKLSTTAKAVSRVYKWPAAFCEELIRHDHNQQDAMIRNAAAELGMGIPEILDGKAEVEASKFFAGSTLALAEAETNVPVPAKRNPKKAAKAEPVKPLPAAAPQPQNEASALVLNTDTRRVINLVETIDNPLRMLDKDQLIMLITSTDWVRPFDGNREVAIDTLWARMKASIVKRLSTCQGGIAEEDVEDTLIGIGCEKPSPTEDSDDNETTEGA